MRMGTCLAAGCAAGLGLAATGARAEGERTDVEAFLRGDRSSQPDVSGESGATPGGESAGADAGTSPDSGPLSGLTFRLRAGGSYGAEADLDDDAGQVSVSRLAAGLAVTGRPDDRSSLTVRFGSEFSFYDFTDVDTLLPGGGEPIDEAAWYDVGLLYARQLDDHWGVFAGGSVGFAPASGASWDESVIGSAFVGANYLVQEGLRIGIGVGVASRLEDSARFIPVPTIEWQINDRWRVGTVDRAIDVRGLEVAYKATDTLEVFVLGGWASREFRLDDDGPAPEGVFRDERAPIAAGVSWAIASQVSVEAAVGADMWTNYEVLDSDGDELADVDADPALTGWLGVTLRF